MDVSARHLGVSQALLHQVAVKMGSPFGVGALTSEGASVHLQALAYGQSAAVLAVLPWLRWTGGAAVSTRVPTSSRSEKPVRV